MCAMGNAAAVERTLHRSRTFRLGEFWCPPDSPRWQVANVIPDAPHVAFPRTSAIIRHAGDEAILANGNHVMFYNPGQRYVRSLHDPRGDRCWFLELDGVRLAELLEVGEFRFVAGPSDPRVRLLLHAAVRHTSDESADPLLVEEAVTEALSRTVTLAASFHRQRHRPSSPAHRALVERTKELLTATACERLSLEELGRRLHSSEYHLARVFRAGTGASLHRYRNRLRLTLALERLADPDANLALLGPTLGYASHSHFTDSFRAVFGVPPSFVRGRIGRRRMRELRRVAEAPLRGAERRGPRR